MNRNSKFALTAMVAAAAGYIGGLLSAPRSGKQTRQKISKSASKARTDSEKQLKKLYGEISKNIDDVEKKVTSAKTKANQERKEALKTAQDAKVKAKDLLSALRDGDADDPELKKVIKEVKSAKNHLVKFVKTKPKK